VFSGAFTAEEVDAAGNSGSGATTAIQILLVAFMNKSLISVYFTDVAFHW